MTDKKKPTPKNTPEHTIRCGEVTASISCRQSNAGYAYYDFSLGRVWTSMATGKETHGSSFFDRHEQDIIQAVREATAWIQAKSRPVLARQDPDLNVGQVQ